MTDTTTTPINAPLTRSKNPFAALAAYVRNADPGERAALARLIPAALRPHEIAALSRALLAAGMEPETWRPQTWQRWALIVHGMALAGHDSGGRLGAQLARANVAESRVTRLLTARGGAFEQQLPRLLHLLASKDVHPNWYELGELILTESRQDNGDAARAEKLRLRIAGAYFSAQARKESSIA